MAESAPRLDTELVRRGLARSRAHAVTAVEEGRVTVDGRPAVKPSLRVDPAARLDLDGGDRYVSRSALKLVAALEAFPVPVDGRLALDVGASTGGFTQVLLERGARAVIALDVGHGQLAPSVRADPRVHVLEGVNARHLDAHTLASAAGVDRRPQIVVADVSFISLTTILPALVASVDPKADHVLLVKPQFEVGRQRIREGVVRDRGLRHEAVSAVIWAAHDLGLRTAGVISSPVLGTNGNQEYLLWLSAVSRVEPTEWERAVATLK